MYRCKGCYSVWDLESHGTGDPCPDCGDELVRLRPLVPEVAEVEGVVTDVPMYSELWEMFKKRFPEHVEFVKDCNGAGWLLGAMEMAWMAGAGVTRDEVAIDRDTARDIKMSIGIWLDTEIGFNLLQNLRNLLAHIDMCMGTALGDGS